MKTSVSIQVDTVRRAPIPSSSNYRKTVYVLWLRRGAAPFFGIRSEKVTLCPCHSNSTLFQRGAK